jgi:hypothetical protein
MRKLRLYGAMILTLAAGFYVGRMTKPLPVKAAGKPQIVRVAIPDLGSSVYGTLFPGVTVPGGATATAISCTTNDSAVGTCYVLVQ